MDDFAMEQARKLATSARLDRIRQEAYVTAVAAEFPDFMTEAAKILKQADLVRERILREYLSIVDGL